MTVESRSASDEQLDQKAVEAPYSHPEITLTPPPTDGHGSPAQRTAVWALAEGLWPVAIRPSDKRPIGNGWGSVRNTEETLKKRYRDNPDAGVGLCLGPGRGPGESWLVDLEVDGPKGEASLAAFLGGKVAESLGWSSNRGPHRLYLADGTRLLEGLINAGANESTRANAGVYHLDGFPDLEIRIGGHKPDGSAKQIQSVIPPTFGTEGKPREWNGCWTISALPDAAYASLEQLSAERRRPAPNDHVPTGPTPRRSPGRNGAAERYARAALHNAARAVAAAANGERHDVLRRESLAVAGLVKAGVLDEDEYRSVLLEADKANGHSTDDPDDGEALIESALQMAKPRDLSSLHFERTVPTNDNAKHRKERRDKSDGMHDDATGKTQPPPGSVTANLKGDEWYLVEQGHLQLVRLDHAGIVVLDLANFDARITEVITRYDGTQLFLRYKVRGTHANGHCCEIEIEADKYAAMGWVYALGADFAVGPGRDTKDRVRHAVQLFSDKAGIARRFEHTSLGWIQHEGQWLYLHAGGAIGALGPTHAVQVDVPPTLGKYELPPPSVEPGMLVHAVQAHLSIWDLAKSDRRGGRAAASILAMLPFRAVLCAFDAAVHFGGPSGNRKTSLARLAYQHFSTKAQGRNCSMSAGWSDTSNALQRLLYDCRDSLLIVDDLKHDKQVGTAEGIFQAQGNLQNRARMKIDQSLQTALNPRGSLLSTGEIDPRTRSALGRILMVELRAGDIDLGVLTRLQEFGDEGWFALAMAGYIQWLAPRLDDVRREHNRLAGANRQEIGDIPGAHPRHADIVAQLVAAYEIFMRFAVECGAIAEITAKAYAVNARRILIELGRAQSDLQDESKPGRLFLDMIAAALQAQHCHLLNAQDHNAPPTYAGACGWRKDPVYQGREPGNTLEWKVPSNSPCVGFIDEYAKLIYLAPTESAAIAREMARRNGDPQSFAQVGRELLNEGLCQPHTEGTKVRATRGKRIAGHGQKRYLCIPLEQLFEAAEE